MTGPSLWGGVECTVNRLQGHYRDQLVLTGHDDNADDLDRIADLGLEALRYPLLWERTETAPGLFDWAWSDERLARLQRLGLRPILGLVHHGSGPRWTHLLDEGFAPGLARHAALAARRYPWVRDWTPVNEPLTTARFSALYGHWYPHHRDEASLWYALLNQVEATVQSMAAIRTIIPDARLVQTEDFGLCSGTPACADQVAFENDRRWLTWDLLSGRVDRLHPLWDRIARHGLEPRLKRLTEAPCPPDVIGINHYVTSDRFLDDEIEAYPPHLRGGNGLQDYVDVETVRVLPPAVHSWPERLAEVQARYDAILAVTECHLGGCEADRMAWLSECWDAVLEHNRQGGRVEAVTAWALLGGVDWDSLLTQARGHRETGVFHRTSEGLEETAVAALCRRFAARSHGSAERPPSGWWARPDRVLYPRPQVSAPERPRLQLVHAR